MARKTFILFAGEESWRVVSGDGASAPFSGRTPREIAKEARKELEGLGYGARGVILAVPSAWCLAASIPIDDLARGDAKSLLYRFEEKIPWAAEMIAADFIRHEGTALGVCIRVDRVKPIIDALEGEGIAVAVVTSAAMLAAQAVAEEVRDGVLVLRSEAGTDLIAMREGRPIAWAVASDGEDEKVQLGLMALDVGEDARQLVKEAEEAQRLAMRSADAIMRGEIQPWVDLRRGELAAPDALRMYRRGINALLGAAAVLLLALAGVFLWRGYEYRQQGQMAAKQMGEAFAAQYPLWDVPVNVKAVVESEHRRLVGAPSGGVPQEARESALSMLYALMREWPAESAVNVQRITCGADSIDIEGQLRAYEDADVIAGAARKAGMTVPPPVVRKEANGVWSLTLHATKGKAVAKSN